MNIVMTWTQEIIRERNIEEPLGDISTFPTIIMPKFFNSKLCNTGMCIISTFCIKETITCSG